MPNDLRPASRAGADGAGRPTPFGQPPGQRPRPRPHADGERVVGARPRPGAAPAVARQRPQPGPRRTADAVDTVDTVDTAVDTGVLESAPPAGSTAAETHRQRQVRLGACAVAAVAVVVLLRHQLPWLVVALALIGYAATLPGRRFVGFVAVVAVLAAGTVALRVYVVQPYYIPSESMEPTLDGCSGCDEDHILVDKLSYRLHAVRTGDIVVFDRPPGDTAPDKVLVKRVVGVGGDVVQLVNGHVVVDGTRISDSYVNPACGPAPTQPLTGVSKWKVPSGDLFVMGDNRCNSHDSRAFGPIPVSSVVGRAFVIVWPIGRFGLL